MPKVSVLVALASLAMVLAGCVHQVDFPMAVHNRTEEALQVDVVVIDETGVARYDWSLSLQPDEVRVPDRVVLPEGDYALVTETSSGHQRNDTYHWTSGHRGCTIEIRSNGIDHRCSIP